MNNDHTTHKTIDDLGETKAYTTKEDVCKFYTQGKCKHGSNCKFIHERHIPETDSSFTQTHSPEMHPYNGDGGGVTTKDHHQVASPQSSHLTQNELLNFHEISIDEEMILTVIHSLGLIVSTESVHTVKSLLETLRCQCSRSEMDPIAAEKARSAFKALLLANEHEKTNSSSCAGNGGGPPHTPLAAAEGAPSRNLYVHGFGPETDESAVEALFSLFCEVKCVVMKEVLSRSTGMVEGRYCFVWTSCLQQATKARNALHKFSLNGNLLQVSFAKERNSPLEDSSSRNGHRLSGGTNSKDNSPNRKDANVESGGGGGPVISHQHLASDVHASGGVSSKQTHASAQPTMGTNPPSRNLFVANLSESTTSEDIALLFSRVCEVKRVVMKSAGYCFVWTGGVQQAVSSISALHGYNLKGHCIQVAFAKEKGGGGK